MFLISYKILKTTFKLLLLYISKNLDIWIVGLPTNNSHHSKENESGFTLSKEGLIIVASRTPVRPGLNSRLTKILHSNKSEANLSVLRFIAG